MKEDQTPTDFSREACATTAQTLWQKMRRAQDFLAAFKEMPDEIDAAAFKRTVDVLEHDRAEELRLLAQKICLVAAHDRPDLLAFVFQTSKLMASDPSYEVQIAAQQTIQLCAQNRGALVDEASILGVLENASCETLIERVGNEAQASLRIFANAKPGLVKKVLSKNLTRGPWRKRAAALIATASFVRLHKEQIDKPLFDQVLRAAGPGDMWHHDLFVEPAKFHARTTAQNTLSFMIQDNALWVETKPFVLLCKTAVLDGNWQALSVVHDIFNARADLIPEALPVIARGSAYSDDSHVREHAQKMLGALLRASVKKRNWHEGDVLPLVRKGLADLSLEVRQGAMANLTLLVQEDFALPRDACGQVLEMLKACRDKDPDAGLCEQAARLEPQAQALFEAAPVSVPQQMRALGDVLSRPASSAPKGPWEALAGAGRKVWGFWRRSSAAKDEPRNP